MATDSTIDVKIMGWSVRGAKRRLLVTRGQPGAIVLTVYAGNQPVTVVVHAIQLKEAVNRVS
jgi:hypothetical protein